jgi:hypothetical protein
VNTSTESKTRAAHHVQLGGEWALWRDFAVRSTGFGIAGLEVFGAPDEEERLAQVARDPRFREAVAWQSREALRGGVDKLAAGGESPARRRRRADVVAGYWQRYCAKNDTIGFFGPLAWGRFADEGEAIDVSAGVLQAERVVHLETWAVEAVARAVGNDALLPMDPFPERDLRARLAGNGQGLAALDRLEAARAAVAAASPDALTLALDELDRVFEELAGRPAVRGEGDSGGGRTVAYLDCMRDLDLTLGPAVLDELRMTLPAILEASRWWCGRVFARGAEALARVTDGRDGPIGPLLGELMAVAWDLHARMAQRELQRRWASVVDGDVAGVAGRAAVAFADHEPAWRWSAYHSADVQIAAADADALRRGEFLIVLGDFHGGDNPLAQGLFAHRHPRPGAIAARATSEIGPRVELLPPRRGPVNMTARMFPVYGQGDVLVISGDEPTPPGTRAVQIGDVVLTNGEVADREDTFRLPLAELLFLPIFVSAVRTFDPVGDDLPARVTIGRTVIRRAHWTTPAHELAAAGDDLADWARRRGLPRRVFARSPLERKPMLVDFQSPALCRVLRRWSATTAERAPGRRTDGAHRDASRPPRLLAGRRDRPPHDRTATRRRRPHTALRSMTPPARGLPRHVARRDATRPPLHHTTSHDDAAPPGSCSRTAAIATAPPALVVASDEREASLPTTCELSLRLGEASVPTPPSKTIEARPVRALAATVARRSLVAPSRSLSGLTKNDIGRDADPTPDSALRGSGERSDLLWARNRELGARCPSRWVGQAIYPV